MPSSAGLNNPQLRSLLWLAALPLATLAASLLLAFAVTVVPRFHWIRIGAHRAAPQTPIAAPAARPFPASTAAGSNAGHGGDAGAAAANGSSEPASLWPLLTPWAITVDAVALLGLAAVLLVRNNSRRRRGARP
jgi:hypothetical protein